MSDPLTVTLTVDATDNVGVASVEYFRKTTTEETSLGKTSSPFSFDWSITGSATASGPYTFFAKATDSAGNVATSDPIDVQIEVPYSVWSVDGLASTGESPSAIARESDGTLAIAAQCTGTNAKKGWKLLRMSTAGAALTDLCIPIYDDPDTLADHRPLSIVEASTGESFMGGYITTSNAGQARDGYVVRLGPTHSVEWNYSFNGNAGLDDEVHSISLSPDGTRLAVVGSTMVDASVSQAFFVLLDAAGGAPLSSPLLIDGLGGKASGAAVVWHSDGSLSAAVNVGPYSLPGKSDSATYTTVYKVDAALSTTLWTRNVGEAALGNNFVTQSMIEGPNNSVVLCGTSTNITKGVPPAPDSTITAAWAARLQGSSGAALWTYLDANATAPQPTSCHGVSLGGSTPRVVITGSVKQSNIEGTNANATMIRWLNINTGAVDRDAMLATTSGVFGQAVVGESTGFYNVLQGYESPSHLRISRLFQP
ncbi:MAG: Ig-like domain-containing protein [Polyangiaceae bacterium]